MSINSVSHDIQKIFSCSHSGSVWNLAEFESRLATSDRVYMLVDDNIWESVRASVIGSVDTLITRSINK